MVVNATMMISLRRPPAFNNSHLRAPECASEALASRCFSEQFGVRGSSVESGEWCGLAGLIRSTSARWWDSSHPLSERGQSRACHSADDWKTAATSYDFPSYLLADTWPET